MIGRRGFIAGLAASFAAPAIVRASSLMPVKAIVVPPLENIYLRADYNGIGSLSEIVDTTLRNRGAAIHDSLVKNNALFARLLRPLENPSDLLCGYDPAIVAERNAEYAFREGRW